MAFNLRPPPCETIDGLRPPLAGFPYFAGAGEFAFQPEATGYSQANAWWLADASFLVYGDAAFVEETIRNSPLPDQGFRLDWLGTADDNRGMVLASDGALVVVFRGTRLQVHSVLDAAEVVLIHQDDFLIDGSFLFKPAHTGGRVHAGFLSAFNEIRERFDAIVAARRPGQRLWLAGHSLGALWPRWPRRMWVRRPCKVCTHTVRPAWVIRHLRPFCLSGPIIVSFTATIGWSTFPPRFWATCTVGNCNP